MYDKYCCLVLYFKNKIRKFLYCLVLLNSVFLNLVCFDNSYYIIINTGDIYEQITLQYFLVSYVMFSQLLVGLLLKFETYDVW